MLNIFVNPDPVLRKVANDLAKKDFTSAEYKKLFEDMSATMLERDGVGLAAPQIGKSVRLIVINRKGNPLVMVNPQITKKSLMKEWGEEGCLSVPFVFGKVQRHKKITCDFIDSDGNKQTIDASGLMARVIQHEVDHLDGILFIDKAKNIKESKD
jgi:peptide deformylase